MMWLEGDDGIVPSLIFIIRCWQVVRGINDGLLVLELI